MFNTDPSQSICDENMNENEARTKRKNDVENGKTKRIKTEENAKVHETLEGPPKCNMSETLVTVSNSLTPNNGLEEKNSFDVCSPIFPDSLCFSCQCYDDDIVKCSSDFCDKYYHSKCLEKYPNQTEPGLCPLHVCSQCHGNNLESAQVLKNSLLQCVQCPIAFHNRKKCILPGSIILSHDRMTCPLHFESSGSLDVQEVVSDQVNLLFCLECGCNDDLMFCKTCPAACHRTCLKLKSSESPNYTCSRCKFKKKMCAGDIVWAKVGRFRWWPGKFVHVDDLPLRVRKIPHQDKEFPVQFFGKSECYWVKDNHMYPFVYKSVGIEDKNLKHNFKKIRPDPAFDRAVKLALDAIQSKQSQKSIEPAAQKKPPPYKHIRTNRPVGDVQVFVSKDLSDFSACGCTDSQSNPCGYGSMCLNRTVLTECIAEACDAGDRCRNQKFQKLEYAELKPFWTGTRAWGLKCLKDIKKGEFVIEYVGDLIDEEECERRIKEKQINGDTNFYFCTLDSNRIIDAGPKGNLSRFINHSCNPNCETQKWIVNGDVRVGIFATKNIPTGSEITFDYQMDFSHNKKLDCNCGAENCSGLIGKKVRNGTETNSNAVKSDSDRQSSVCKNVKNNSIDLKNTTVKKTDQNETTVTDKLKKINTPCFKCKARGKQIQCTVKRCGKSFHIRCLRSSISNCDFVLLNWKCPCHFCVKCKKKSLFQCDDCPNSYCSDHAGTNAKVKLFHCPKHS